MLLGRLKRELRELSPEVVIAWGGLHGLGIFIAFALSMSAYHYIGEYPFVVIGFLAALSTFLCMSFKSVPLNITLFLLMYILALTSESQLQRLSEMNVITWYTILVALSIGSGFVFQEIRGDFFYRPYSDFTVVYRGDKLPPITPPLPDFFSKLSLRHLSEALRDDYFAFQQKIIPHTTKNVSEVEVEEDRFLWLKRSYFMVSKDYSSPFIFRLRGIDKVRTFQLSMTLSHTLIVQTKDGHTLTVSFAFSFYNHKLAEPFSPTALNFSEILGDSLNELNFDPSFGANVMFLAASRAFDPCLETGWILCDVCVTRIEGENGQRISFK